MILCRGELHLELLCHFLLPSNLESHLTSLKDLQDPINNAAHFIGLFEERNVNIDVELSTASDT